jgi:hypothetical protein
MGADVGMYGYLAAVSAENAESLGSVPEYDAFMAILTGDGSVELGQTWDAVDRVVGELLEGRGSLSSGIPITDDLGFGPATFLSLDEVQSMAAVLSGVSEARLVGAFAALEMADVYPMVWDRPEDVETNASGTLVATRATIALIERAAVRREGMLFVVL